MTGTQRGSEIVLALAGDAMLGGSAPLKGGSSPALLSPELEHTIREADLFVLNLECCISRRGEKWPAPGKRFFFRAPPEAAESLARLGVSCVTLANNHALDFGREALLDTLDHLARAGIRTAGAGADLAAARTPAVLEARGLGLCVVGATDHPPDFAAADDEPGVAFADLRSGEVPGWLPDTLKAAHAAADMVLFAPHWGPNLSARPPRHVRAAAAVLAPHATLIAGHSAHAFHGVQGNVLYDLGDFMDQYVGPRQSRNLFSGTLRKLSQETLGLVSELTTVRRRSQSGHSGLSLWELQRRRADRIARLARARTLRPDLGMLFLVTLDRAGPKRLEAVPLKIGRGRTRLASGPEAAYAHERFRSACAALGTLVEERRGRGVIVWR